MATLDQNARKEAERLMDVYAAAPTTKDAAVDLRNLRAFLRHIKASKADRDDIILGARIARLANQFHAANGDK